MSRLRRAYLRQRRYAVDEIRLKELTREGHQRAKGVNKISLDIYGVEMPVDITSDYANIRRRLLGLGEIDFKSGREEVLVKINRVADLAECLFRLDNKAMYLIQERRGYYFLYREKGSYYKKSCLYATRLKAMERYQEEKITWLHFVDETGAK